MGIKVAKFGGSSVADAIQIRKLSDIVKADDAMFIAITHSPRYSLRRSIIFVL